MASPIAAPWPRTARAKVAIGITVDTFTVIEAKATVSAAFAVAV
jgi:hypothetical protein